MKILAFTLVFLLSGCASGIRAVTPFTTEEVERKRAECLAAGHIWMESQNQAACRPVGERT